ncbi:MAG TPA: PRC-barrel domain-containing protein [Trebonia sp.]
MHFIDPNVLAGLPVIGSRDVALGTVEDVYADIRSGRPQWAAVKSGLFGTDVSLIPLTRAECDDRSLRIPYSVQEVRDAPHRASGAVMSRKEEANLFRHYGANSGSAGPSAGKSVTQGRTAAGRTRGTGRTMLHKYTAPSASKAG